jgi:hypothetical protein
MNKLTAIGLYENLTMDTTPSIAQMVDFGIDIAEDREALMRAYQRGIKDGSITVEMLSEALGNGDKLTELLGMEVNTIWDDLEEEEEEEEEEEDLLPPSL